MISSDFDFRCRPVQSHTSHGAAYALGQSGTDDLNTATKIDIFFIFKNLARYFFLSRARVSHALLNYFFSFISFLLGVWGYFLFFFS